MPPVSRVLRRRRIRSSKARWRVSPPCLPIGALPRRQSHSRLCCNILRRELAITRLDWPFAPFPKSEERIAYQYPFRPPSGFRLTSPCSGKDHLVSSLIRVTSGPLRPSDSPYGCSPFGFPMLTGLIPLGSPRKRTPRPVIRNGTCDPGPPPPYRQVTLVSFGWLQPFRAATVCNYLISGTFNAPLGGLFSFPSPY